MTLNSLLEPAAPHPAPEVTARTGRGGVELRELRGAFWTAVQRQASRLHEVPYRACFKPQLPRYFIERFTKPGDVVLDPFSGRGTTAVEAGLLGRRVIANDVNPLARLLAEPRLEAPELAAIAERLKAIPRRPTERGDAPDLSMFYEARTEAELLGMRAYLLSRARNGREDAVDRWIRMVATNRLTGHSSGFFSVYSLPPNQAVRAERQRVLNAERGQQPEYRDTHALILKKSRNMLSDLDAGLRANLRAAAASAQFLTGDAQKLLGVAAGSVQLTVTSPPFLDVVQYDRDNWLRGWFNGLDVAAIAGQITMPHNLAEWSAKMGKVLRELHRVTAAGGHLAFEVGEIRKGTLRLEDVILPLGAKAGFVAKAVLINTQSFTKTANIWGIGNNRVGTNSNRIVLFRKH